MLDIRLIYLTHFACLRRHILLEIFFSQAESRYVFEFFGRKDFQAVLSTIKPFQATSSISQEILSILGVLLMKEGVQIMVPNFIFSIHPRNITKVCHITSICIIQILVGSEGWLVTLFELVRWTRSKRMLIFNPADICLHANKCL